MSAVVIPLKLRREPAPTNIRSDNVQEVLAADPASPVFDGARVRLILEDLRTQQDTLLSVIESMREASLQAQPDLVRLAADLEAASIQVLAEAGLLIRGGTRLLSMHEIPEA
jgi:uncharacterized protein involved in exopolysaccharide biosynthesis